MAHTSKLTTILLFPSRRYMAASRASWRTLRPATSATWVGGKGDRQAGTWETRGEGECVCSHM